MLSHLICRCHLSLSHARLTAQKADSSETATSHPPAPESTGQQIAAASRLSTAELLLHSIGELRFAFLDGPRLTHVDLLKRVVGNALSWDAIADRYSSAEGCFRACEPTMSPRRIKRAYADMRVLVLPLRPGTAPVWERRLSIQVAASRLWRICHRLLEKDAVWSKYEYSFLLAFLLELERLMRDVCGGRCPVRVLLLTLCQIPRVETWDVLLLGAARTVDVMAPVLTGGGGGGGGGERAAVLRHWSDYISWTGVPIIFYVALLHRGPSTAARHIPFCGHTPFWVARTADARYWPGRSLES